MSMWPFGKLLARILPNFEMTLTAVVQKSEAGSEQEILLSLLEVIDKPFTKWLHEQCVVDYLLGNGLSGCPPFSLKSRCSTAYKSLK